MSLKPVENRWLTAVNHPVNWAVNRTVNRGSTAKFFSVSNRVKIFKLLQNRSNYVKIAALLYCEHAEAAGISHIDCNHLVYEFTIY